MNCAQIATPLFQHQIADGFPGLSRVLGGETTGRVDHAGYPLFYSAGIQLKEPVQVFCQLQYMPGYCAGRPARRSGVRLEGPNGAGKIKLDNLIIGFVRNRDRCTSAGWPDDPGLRPELLAPQSGIQL